MKKFNFLNYSDAMERIMHEWYSYTRETLHHGGDLGFAREHFVKEILSSFLPKTVIVGNGEIIDGFGKRSGQQDIIIYRADFPVITSLSPVNTFLVEGVIATIEIKSDLSTGEPNLASAFRSVEGVLSLTKAAKPIHGEQKDIKKLIELSSIKTYVVGYSGWKSTESFMKNYMNAGDLIGWSNPPHLVYQPRACLIRNDGFMNPNEESDNSGFLFHEENPFSVFLHHLLKSIMINTNGMIVQVKGVEALMNYYLDPYFNFDPPLRFQKLNLVPMS